MLNNRDLKYCTHSLSNPYYILSILSYTVHCLLINVPIYNLTSLLP